MILLKNVSYWWEDGEIALNNINLEIKKGKFILISGRSGSISVPFSVLLRFAPTMRHEVKALKENMRIRGVIKSKFFIFLYPVKYVEYILFLF